MTMQNVAGLGLGVRARPAVRSRVTLGAKPSVFGAPVVGKSVKGISSRKTVTPMAMSAADGAIPAGMKRVEVPPVAEAPFVGITKDMKARAPLYINDFVQGISFKSVVSASDFFSFPFFFPARPKDRGRPLSIRRVAVQWGGGAECSFCLFRSFFGCFFKPP